MKPHTFGGPHANDDANPTGISLGFDPFQCRGCKFVGTVLDTAMPFRDGKPTGGKLACGRCGSTRLNWTPPQLRNAT